MSTAFVYDPIYLEHNLPEHPENARRLERILALLEESGLRSRLVHLQPRPASVEELERVHSRRLISLVQSAAQSGGGYLEPDTYVTPRSFEAAVMAAGGVIRAVEAVLSGEIGNGFALVRPPGHHATPTQAMGFCLFNNVAVAARAALASGKVARVFIADFDVHHGNGTQEAFAEDPRVFYFSVHQFPHYPGTGYWNETGYGEGKGTVLNVPLLAGTGDAGYATVFAELVWPLAERFQPELILVSAGYDAHWKDPLAQMHLSLAGYAHLARELVSMSKQLCGGRTVWTLEGGYNLDTLAYGVLNSFYALLGEDFYDDPFGPSPYPEPPLGDLIARIKRIHNLN